MSAHAAAPDTTPTRPRVLITDHSWPDIARERDVLAEAGAEVLTPDTADDTDELVRLASTGVDAIMTCFAQVPDRVIGASDRLRLVARYGVGLDNIDVEAATRRSVLVTNVPDYCQDEVAEHALALVLALRRGIVTYHSAVRDRDWSLAVGQPLYRIRGLTLGLVGMGRIGMALARRAHGFGMTILGTDPNRPVGSTLDGVEVVDTDSLLQASDVVSLHVPLTDETHHLIGDRELALMKPTAHLVNTARGGLVDLDALEAALDDGRLAGAGLDVVDPEPLLDHPLLDRASVIITPHVSFYSEDSIQDLQVRTARSVVDVLTGRVPQTLVNPEVLGNERWAHLRADESGGGPP